jgi:adenosine deaminase
MTAQNIHIMPKIDLHRHLEGCIRPTTIYDLSKKFNYFNPKPNIMELNLKMQVNGTEQSLFDFIMKLGTPYMLQYTRNKESMKRFAYEACEDAARDGILYLELRCCPSNYYKTPISAEEFIEGVSEGMKMAEKDFVIDTGLIISIKREDPLDMNWQIVNLAIRYFEKGIVHGVDLCGNEPAYPTRRYKELFDTLYKNEIPITVHAGESSDIQHLTSIVEAITLLHAQRIGHCTLASKSPKVMNMLFNKNILLEVCPTSNVHTKIIDSLENHPIYKFYESRNAVTINTDDPVTSNITLSNEYEKLIKYHNLSTETFKKANLYSILFAFQNLRKKIELKEKYIERFEQWEKIVQEEHEYTHHRYMFNTDQLKLQFCAMN